MRLRICEVSSEHCCSHTQSTELDNGSSQTINLLPHWLAAHAYLNSNITNKRRAILTHLCQMYFPILIKWTRPFPILGLLSGIFHFYINFKRNPFKQTVENLVRRRFMRRLIWCCTVCRCPRKRTLGFYGLIARRYVSFYFIYI